MKDDLIFTYDELVKRNLGYISAELQERIRNTRILIAGCGIGSTVAESLVRIGFESITLVDGDIVEMHNLNRQAYTFEDVGKPKVTALAQRLKSIYPNACITEYNNWITPNNVKEFVSKVDIVFDAIDLLSLEGIVALHDECHRQKKPIISSMSAGWGAAAIYFPKGTDCTFRKLFGIPKDAEVKNESYVKHFKVAIKRLSEKLDPDIVEALSKALTLMEDGIPCPAPHISAGSTAVAALSVTIAVRILAGKPITVAPRMIVLNISDICTNVNIDLSA